MSAAVKKTRRYLSANISLRELKRMVRHWQVKLRLESWRIRVFWEPELEAQGRVYWESKMWDATILIKPLGAKEERCPIEKTVIHELLHLHFAPLGDPGPDWVEFAVESMAQALYKTGHGIEE